MIRIVYDDIHWLHRGPVDHPENPFRIEIIVNTLLKKNYWSRLVVEETVESNIEDLYSVHSREYVQWIIDECKRGFHYIDSDTYVTKHSFEVASRFSSKAREIGYKCLREKDIWFILARPPGHHAGFNGIAMNAPSLGFCIFNHVAVVVKTLLDHLDKVVVIDFDLHHGNGTQEIFWNDNRVIHIDIHEYGIYPGSGYVSENGGFRARGSKINIPLSKNSGDSVYAWILKKIVEPVLYKYKPSVIVVSAGFDPFIGEPMSGLKVSDKVFHLYGYFFYQLYSDGVVKSIVNVLEGGYGIGLRKGFIAYLEGLMGINRDYIIDYKPVDKRVYESLVNIMLKYHGLEID